MRQQASPVTASPPENPAPARKILSLMPLNDYDPDGDLLSPKAGRRLAAYLALVADPDASHAEELTRTLTEREGIPFNQSWALRALSRIVEINGASSVSSKGVAQLRGMRTGSGPGQAGSCCSQTSRTGSHDA
jgi:hypothetical protein